MATAQNIRTAPGHASRRPRPAGADPIFAAIAALKRATTKYKAAEKAALASENYSAADAALTAEYQAGVAVVDLEPTTRAGAVAQLRVLATLIDGPAGDDFATCAPETIRRALAVIEAAAR